MAEVRDCELALPARIMSAPRSSFSPRRLTYGRPKAMLALVHPEPSADGGKLLALAMRDFGEICNNRPRAHFSPVMNALRAETGGELLCFCLVPDSFICRTRPFG